MPVLTWIPYPGNPPQYMYGHTMILRAFLEGSIRLLDEDGTVVVTLEGKGLDQEAKTTFQSPSPDPGQPHIGTVETTVGANIGGFQLYKED